MKNKTDNKKISPSVIKDVVEFEARFGKQFKNLKLSPSAEIKIFLKCLIAVVGSDILIMLFLLPRGFWGHLATNGFVDIPSLFVGGISFQIYIVALLVSLIVSSIFVPLIFTVFKNIEKRKLLPKATLEKFEKELLDNFRKWKITAKDYLDINEARSFFPYMKLMEIEKKCEVK